MKTKTSKRTTYIVRIAILGTLATVLMLFEFPMPFIAPSFYEFDFSEVPVLIGTFSLGPVAGIFTELIKILLNFLLNGTITAGVGEAANFVMGCAFIVPAGLIYKHRKNIKTAILGMLTGTLVMAAVSLVINAYIMIPTYGKALNIPTEAFIGMGKVIFPSVNSVFDMVLFCVVPFNLIKGTIISVITFFLYKPLHPLLKKISF